MAIAAFILILLVVAVVYILGQQHIDINHITTNLVPKTNGVSITSTDDLVKLLVIVALSIVIGVVVAYIVHKHYHAQEYALRDYTRRYGRELVAEYQAKQASRLAIIARMFYHFN